VHYNGVWDQKLSSQRCNIMASMAFKGRLYMGGIKWRPRVRLIVPRGGGAIWDTS
jgi:hypothetical protein